MSTLNPISPSLHWLLIIDHVEVGVVDIDIDEVDIDDDATVNDKSNGGWWWWYVHPNRTERNRPMRLKPNDIQNI